MDPTNAMVQRMPSLRLELGIHRLALMHFFFFSCAALGGWTVAYLISAVVIAWGLSKFAPLSQSLNVISWSETGGG